MFQTRTRKLSSPACLLKNCTNLLQRPLQQNGARSSDEKAASEYVAVNTHLVANIDALTRAIAALEKGVAGSSFLQSSVGSSVRRVVQRSQTLSDTDRSTVLSFSVPRRPGKVTLPRAGR